MALVRKVDGVWRAWTAPENFQTGVESTRTESYKDGRVLENVPCEPYPIYVTLDPLSVARVLLSGAWTQEDLDPLGIKQSIPEPTREGFDRGASLGYEEQEDGSVLELFEFTEAKAAEAPPELSRSEKLARMAETFGLSLDDLKAELLAPAKE